MFQAAVLAKFCQQSLINHLLPHGCPLGVIVGRDGPAQQLHRLGIGVFHYLGGSGRVAAAQGLLVHEILLRVEVRHAVHGEHRRIPVAEPAVGAVLVEKAHHIFRCGHFLARDGEFFVQLVGALVGGGQRYVQRRVGVGLAPPLHRHQRHRNGKLGRPAAPRAQRGNGNAAASAGQGSVQRRLVAALQRRRVVGPPVIDRRREGQRRRAVLCRHTAQTPRALRAVQQK